MDNKDILTIDSLEVTFNTLNGSFSAIKDVSFELKEGEILGIVGESGCGKSITSLSIMGLLPKGISKLSHGDIIYNNTNLSGLSEKQMRKYRGKDISMIFQEPMTSLNPVYTVGNQIAQVIKNHEEKISKKEINERIIDLLTQVGLPRPEKIKNEYPHQLSGGMRQRVMIAIAISCNPKILIADEPTTALDVTIQAQILELLKKLSKERNMSLILITHDMGVVAEMCDRVIVMYSGQIVEQGNKDKFFEKPTHPYSKGLLSSIPEIGQKDRELNYIKGNVPHPTEKIVGCKFKDRCQYAFDKCSEEPYLLELENKRLTRCWLYGDEVM